MNQFPECARGRPRGAGVHGPDAGPSSRGVCGPERGLPGWVVNGLSKVKAAWPSARESSLSAASPNIHCATSTPRRFSSFAWAASRSVLWALSGVSSPGEQFSISAAGWCSVAIRASFSSISTIISLMWPLSLRSSVSLASMIRPRVSILSSATISAWILSTRSLWRSSPVALSAARASLRSLFFARYQRLATQNRTTWLTSSASLAIACVGSAPPMVATAVSTLATEILAASTDASGG